MALVLANRVQETATPNTTVSFTLTGAVLGFQNFSVIGNGNTTYYSATDGAGNWEVGVGTYSTTGPTLTRDTVYASSNSGSPVTFPGTVNVFVTYPSGRSVNLDGSGNVSALGTVSSGTWQGSTVGVAYGGTGVTTSSGANSVMLRDANQNVAVNRLNQSNTSTTAAGGTTALTAASSYIHTLVGTGGQTYTMPDATTLTTGVAFVFNNMATGTLTIQNYATGAVGTIPAGGAGAVFLTDNSTVGGIWDIHAYLPEGVTFGTNAFNLGTSLVSGGTWQGGTIQPGYGGTGLTTFVGANNALYSTGATTLTAGTLPAAAGGTGLTSFTANGVVYASGTGTLATGSALTFDGTNLINSGNYTAPSNGAGVGTTTSIRGSTGTGQAGFSGGNGFIQLLGGGGVSSWTAFSGSNARRRGGILLQAGTAQADSGNTYVNGSFLDLRGSNGTNNGTFTGQGTTINLVAGATVRTDTFTSNGVSVTLNGGQSTLGGNFTLTCGSFVTSTGTNNGAAITGFGGTATTGGDVLLTPGVAVASGSTSGKAYVVTNSISQEILTTGNITTTAITAATAGSVPYFNGSKILTTGSALTFDGAILGVNGVSVGRGAGAVSSNTAIGTSALLSNTTASNNTAVGYEAAYNNTTGVEQVAIGYQAMYYMRGGNNTAVGSQSMRGSTTAGNNTGNSNSAFGYQSLYSLTNGNNNTAIGTGALYNNTSGGFNTAVGDQAGFNATSGVYNVMVGGNAHYGVTSGSRNVSVGYEATYYGGGTDRVSIGYQAGYNYPGYSLNAIVAIGADTHKFWFSGTNNVAIGHRALYSSGTSYYQSGSSNTVVGAFAAGYGLVIRSGGSNTLIGYQAGFNYSSGNSNTCVGLNAFYTGTTGNNNTCMGVNTLYSGTSGGNNTCMGVNTLYSGTTGSANTCIGFEALYKGTTGDHNTALGRGAGYSTAAAVTTNGITTGSENIYVGGYAYPSGVAVTREIVIGYDSTGKGANTGFINANGGGVYQGNNSTTWSTTSDARIKQNFNPVTNGLEVINALDPFEFDYILTGKHDVGFKAQQYMTVLPDQVQKHAASDAEKELVGDDEIYGIQRNLDPYLVSAIKSLTEQVKALQQEIAQIKGV